MTYREDLARAVREGERASRKLAKLNELPDLDELANGIVIAVNVAYRGTDRSYTYIGHKVGGRWYFTGTGSPNNADSDRVLEWLTKGPRHVRGIIVLAEIEVVTVPAVDLSPLLAGVRDFMRLGSNSDQPSHNRYGG